MFEDVITDGESVCVRLGRREGVYGRSDGEKRRTSEMKEVKEVEKGGREGERVKKKGER